MDYYGHSLLLGALSLLLLGCEEKLQSYPVKGKVVYRGTGQPLPAGGVITLVPDAEPMPDAEPKLEASATIDAAGNFELDGEGAVPGEYKVRIDPELPDDPQSSLNPRLARAKTLSEKYSDAQTSGLAVTIEPKENVLTIEVEKPK